MSNNDVILEVTTVQTGPFKILVDALKDFLIDCNIECIPVETDNISTDENAGLKILALNSKEGMLVHLKLHAYNFDKYICYQKQYLGINMQSLYKILKSMTNSDILTIKRGNTNKDRNRLCFEIKNTDREQKFEWNLQLLDIDSDILDISSASFQAVVIMTSADFQKVCRDMNGVEAKYVDITLCEDTLIFECKGEFADGRAEYKDINTKKLDSKGYYPTITIKRGESFEKGAIITGKYELKNLLLFTKCTSLCNHIEIYLQNEFPLLIKYTVASLGFIHLCLSPILDMD